MSGKLWKQIPYGVNKKSELLDYEELLHIAKKEKPQLIIAGFTAYSRTIDWKKFRKIADAVGAYLMVDMSHISGLVAAGAYPSPFPYADVVTTTTHKTLRGPRGALIFSRDDDRGLPERINRAIFPGLQGGPHLHTIAGITVALGEAMKADFKTYATQVVKNSQALVLELEHLGWRIVSGGTDSHLLLLDTWMGGKGVSGKQASELLEENGIIVNMNTIPYDERKPLDPSGIRLGTAYETSRGKKQREMKQIAHKIDQVLRGNMVS
jgi:glycine hydroxymethyltransferase